MEREWVHAARVTAGAKHTLDAECTKGIRFQAKDELLRARALWCAERNKGSIFRKTMSFAREVRFVMRQRL